jgi:hypothetical protein
MTSTCGHPALYLSDHQLLQECEVHTYRASGPGGQKRNKVESAVRIRHIPTGVAAIATESRSQLENRPRALRRLREAIALSIRSPVDVTTFSAPAALLECQGDAGRLRLSERNPTYPVILAIVLDVLAACEGRAGVAASALGMSTHHLTLFLSEHPRAWQAANRIRQGHGLRPLRSD